MSAPAAVPLLTNVLYETKGPIAYVTVNRPEVLNALDSDTWGDLERAFDERSSYMAYFKVTPFLDALKGDPRFAQMAERLGLSR